MKKLISLALLVSVLAAGCATVTGPGAQEGAVPPRLVMRDGAKAWDNPGSFGPVPASMVAKGAASCALLNSMGDKFVASGYHSRAQDFDGKPFVDGGYYCVRQ